MPFSMIVCVNQKKILNAWVALKNGKVIRPLIRLMENWMLISHLLA